MTNSKILLPISLINLNYSTLFLSVFLLLIKIFVTVRPKPHSLTAALSSRLAIKTTAAAAASALLLF